MERLRPELFAEIACATPSRAEFELAVLRALNEQIGADVAFFCAKGGVSDVALGFDQRVRAPFRERWREMAREVEELLPAAERSRWAVVDSQWFGAKLPDLVYYDTVMRPHRGRTTLLGFLRCHGSNVGMVALGRSVGSSSFRTSDCALLGEVLPTLSLAQQSYALERSRAEHRTGERGDAFAALSKREREVLGYLGLGYTNQQIALALGSAPRTVRNQLSSVYEKLGVSGRAEAVAAVHGANVPSTDPAR
jgi:DNA-binding CsgD family transcriptional regulator